MSRVKYERKGWEHGFTGVEIDEDDVGDCLILKYKVRSRLEDGLTIAATMVSEDKRGQIF